MRKSLFLLLFPCMVQAASQRAVREEMSAADISAINQNFKNINDELMDTVHKTSTETIRGQKYFAGHILPGADSTYNIGAAANEWAGVYADTATFNYSVFMATAAGRVGVGTASPVMKFHILGSDNVANFSASGTTNMLRVVPQTSRVVAEATNAAQSAYAPLFLNGSTLSLGVGASTATHIIATGEVGIGKTPASGTQLDILTTGNYAIDLSKTSADANLWIKLTNDARSYLVGVRGDTADNFVVYDNVAGSDRLYVQSNGNTHVLPTSEAADAHLEVSNSVTTGGGTVHAATYGAHSSRDLKSNITYLTRAELNAYYDGAKDLRPVTFKYKRFVDPRDPTRGLEEDPNGKIRRGLIFEDVPNELRDRDNSISLNDQIFMLQAAIQVLIEKVEALEIGFQDLNRRLEVFEVD